MWGVFGFGDSKLRFANPFCTTLNTDKFLEYDEYGYQHEFDAHTLLLARVFLKNSKIMRFSFFASSKFSC